MSKTGELAQEHIQEAPSPPKQLRPLQSVVAIATIAPENRLNFIHAIMPAIRSQGIQLLWPIIGAIFALVLPTGKTLKKARRATVIGTARRYYRKLVALHNISNIQQQTRRIIRRHLNHMAIIEARQTLYIQQGLIIGFVGTLAVSPLFIGYLGNFQMPSWAAIGSFIVFGPLGILITLLILAGLTMASKIGRIAEWILIWVLSVGTYIFISHYPLIGQSGHSVLSEMLRYAAMVSVYGPLSFVAFVLLLSLPDYIVWERERRRHPEAAIVTELTDLIFKLEHGPVRWHQFDFRREAMASLEAIAQRLRRDVPRSLRSGDTLRDTWTRETFDEIAEGMQELKRWLILPKSDTRDRLIARLNSTLICTATSNWDGLERQKRDPEAVKSLTYVKLQTLAKHIGMTLILEASLLLCKYLGVPMPRWAFLIGVGYFFVLYLPQFQPTVMSLLDIAQRIKNLYDRAGK